MLAAGLWLSRRRTVVAVAPLVAGVLAVFDIAEVAHQLDDSRRALAALAVAVALGHAAIVLIGTTWERSLRSLPDVEVFCGKPTGTGIWCATTTGRG